MPFPVYQLYLLQLEEYNLERYWKLLLKSGYIKPKRKLRKEIAWTPKTISIMLMTIVLYALLIYLVLSYSSILFAIAMTIVYTAIVPFVYSVITILLLPIDLLFKKSIIMMARNKVKSINNLHVIGIAGSYGKTTMKNVLATVVSRRFNTIFTPASINTPVGIARWLIKNLTNEKEILIVEMGEHYKGDIRYLCSIAKPTISILTGVNEAHLERLSKIEDSIETIFEVAKHAKKNAPVILNADDNHLINNYSEQTQNKKVFFYSSKGAKESTLKISEKSFDNENLKWNFTIEDYDSLKSSLLGEYGAGCIMGSILVAKYLKMNKEKIGAGINQIKPIEHRLQPIKNGGILVIDDSYNGNPDGAKEAINLLAKFPEKRKIYLTPGLVETGDQTRKVHFDIGKQLSQIADKVILIKNSVTPFIEEGLIASDFKQENVIWFNTAQDAHNALNGIIKEKDVILFQNDWGDQYL